MIREFDEDELKPAERGGDTELTLSAGTLLALGGGLVLLCGVCFGLGYAVGHRSEAVSSGSTPVAATQSSLQPGNSATKPTPGEKTPVSPPPVTIPVDATTPQPAEAASAELARTSSAEQQGNLTQQGQVKPALAGQSSVSESAQPASALHVQPAFSQVQGWMVQIAAVSHVEDAEVLVNALKKRGYTVTVRRDVADSLLHVQTGPFVGRNEANAMRQKLLNDGYNAIVQP